MYKNKVKGGVEETWEGQRDGRGWGALGQLLWREENLLRHSKAQFVAKFIGYGISCIQRRFLRVTRHRELVRERQKESADGETERGFRRRGFPVGPLADLRNDACHAVRRGCGNSPRKARSAPSSGSRLRLTFALDTDAALRVENVLNKGGLVGSWFVLLNP